MPYRTFLDSAGTEWQVWDIVPQLSERREVDVTDRREIARAIDFPNRRRDSRRLSETRRAVLRGSYAQGWLCFESNKDKRRLSPIPPDWRTCSDDLLEAYSRRGERVSGSRPVVMDFNAEEPVAETGS